MKKATCGRCGKEFSLSEMVRTDDQTLCIPCANAALSAGVELGKVTRLVDDTICGNCHEDFGRDELPPVAGVPMCRKCTEHFRHRPFPTWVKVAAAGLAVLVIFGMWRSLRFVEGYLAAKRAVAASAAHDLDRTHAEMALALEKVPESLQFQVEEPLLHGIILLRDDKDEEALEVFHEAQRRAGGKRVDGLDGWILQAEIGAAFNRKDYDAFLARSQDQLRLTNNAQSNAYVASALACKYAVTGDETYKARSLDALTKAKQLAAAEKADLGDYVERIEHRLTSREIITTGEYHKRFPKPEGQGTP